MANSPSSLAAQDSRQDLVEACRSALFSPHKLLLQTTAYSAKRQAPLALLLAFLLFSSHAALGQSTTTTGPASQSASSLLLDLKSTGTSARDWPYLTADLLVSNQSRYSIHWLDIRPALGGPTVRVPAVIPPNSEMKLSVALPAVSPHAVYTVTRFPADNPNARTDGLWPATELTILWPPEWIDQARPALIDADAYRPYATRLPQWPDATKRMILIVLIATVLAAGGILWIGRTPIRLLAGAAILAASSVGIWLALSAVPLVEDLTQTNPAPGASEKQVVLAARRHTSAEVGGNYYPVYRNVAQMQRDDSVNDMGKKLRLHLDPDELRIFRPRGR